MTRQPPMVVEVGKQARDIDAKQFLGLVVQREWISGHSHVDCS